MVKNDEEKALESKYAEESLDRKAKATVQWNYNCSIRMFKNLVKRESSQTNNMQKMRENIQNKQK